MGVEILVECTCVGRGGGDAGCCGGGADGALLSRTEGSTGG